MNPKALPIDKKIRATLSNGLLRSLLAENPSRRAWFDLDDETKERAFATAREKAATGRAEKAFSTLLIEELDIAIDLKTRRDATTPRAEHVPEHDHAQRQKERRAVEKAYNDAYENVWHDAHQQGDLSEAAAHAKAHAAGEAARRRTWQRLHDERIRAEEAEANKRRNELRKQIEILGAPFKRTPPG